MQKNLLLHLNDQSVCGVKTQVIPAENHLLALKPLLEPDKRYFIPVQHSGINTTLDLTDCIPWVLLYFDKKRRFTGAAYSLNRYNGPFFIKTQARYILLMPYPVRFALNKVGRFSYSKGEQKRNELKYILIMRPGDPEIIDEYAEDLSHKSNRELLDILNRQLQVGITGVHRQALYLTALQQQLQIRFSDCPIKFDKDGILWLEKQINGSEHTS